MQAQLEIKRSPSTLFVALFALIATLLLGGALGYTLKPASVVSGPARMVVVHDQNGLTAPGSPSYTTSDCIETINHHKAC